MADWGLQAVIRPTEYDDHDHHHHHHHHQHQHQHQHHDHGDLFGSIDIKKEYDQALLFCFPHLFDHGATTGTMETSVVTDELDQLHKPFYQLPAASSTADIQTIHHDSDQEIQQHQEQEIKKFCGSSAPKTSQLAPKLKKRKNQQKRVVVQVTADGLSSDPWAWRKYGQKPIKGSIYPRSYYRCSSSKGCMARRQVEQSCTDSNIFILTYTAEHNHQPPTRRNSLAGINRNRFKATSKCTKTVTISKDSHSFQSPTTPNYSVSSIEDEVIQQSNIKQESKLETFFYNNLENIEGHYTMMPGINDDDDYMFLSDDFFEGLEDL